MIDLLAYIRGFGTGFLPLSTLRAQTLDVIDGVDPFSTDPGGAVNSIIKISVGLAVAIGIVLVAAAGYRMMSSGGDAAKLKDARDQLQNAILGLILVLAAVTIMGIVFNIIGIEGIL
jgi:hypothetical protein